MNTSRPPSPSRSESPLQRPPLLAAVPCTDIIPRSRSCSPSSKTLYQSTTNGIIPEVLRQLIASSFSNVYIRGLPTFVTDKHLHTLCSQYGHVLSAKAIMDLTMGKNGSPKCKGYGFVLFSRHQDALQSVAKINSFPLVFGKPGILASIAKQSFTARLKVLQDELSCNIYCSNLPKDWTEPDLIAFLYPLKVISARILTYPDGTSKCVGFARMVTRDVATQAIKALNKTVIVQGATPIQIRFADSPAQRNLKKTHVPPPKNGIPGPSRPCVGDAPDDIHHVQSSKRRVKHSNGKSNDNRMIITRHTHIPSAKQMTNFVAKQTPHFFPSHATQHPHFGQPDYTHSVNTFMNQVPQLLPILWVPVDPTMYPIHSLGYDLTCNVAQFVPFLTPHAPTPVLASAAYSGLYNEYSVDHLQNPHFNKYLSPLTDNPGKLPPALFIEMDNHHLLGKNHSDDNLGAVPGLAV